MSNESGHRPPTSVIIGIGNVLRRDDGVGEFVVSRVRSRLPARVGRDVQAFSVDGEPTAIVDLWDGVELAVVVDTVMTGAKPGTVHHVELDAVGGTEVVGLLSADRTTANGCGVVQALELGTALNRLPHHLVVYGVEGHDLGDGTELTPAVSATANALAARVVKQVTPSPTRG